jgi:small subunit ribosomal protein S17
VTQERGRRKTLVGVVVSNKMDKTAVVSVERRHPHPLYRKIIRTTKRYKAHDPNNAAQLGDVVRLEETRPLSKEKRWRIAETMTRGNVADIAPRDIGAPVEPEAETPAVATPVAAAAPAPAAEASASPVAAAAVAEASDAEAEAPALEAAAEEPTAAAESEPVAEAATAEAPEAEEPEAAADEPVAEAETEETKEEEEETK